MSVMHSIVLALGIARVLGGIAGVARDWRRLETMEIVDQVLIEVSAEETLDSYNRIKMLISD